MGLFHAGGLRFRLQCPAPCVWTAGRYYWGSGWGWGSIWLKVGTQTASGRPCASGRLSCLKPQIERAWDPNWLWGSEFTQIHPRLAPSECVSESRHLSSWATVTAAYIITSPQMAPMPLPSSPSRNTGPCYSQNSIVGWERQWPHVTPAWPDSASKSILILPFPWWRANQDTFLPHPQGESGGKNIPQADLITQKIPLSDSRNQNACLSLLFFYPELSPSEKVYFPVSSFSWEHPFIKHYGWPRGVG